MNLPKDTKAGDACTLLDNWLPEVLDLALLSLKLILERAHRIEGAYRHGGAQTTEDDDAVRNKLWNMGIRCGMLLPGRLLVTYEDTHLRTRPMWKASSNRLQKKEGQTKTK